MDFYYDEGGKLFDFSYNGIPYYIKNLQSDIIRILDRDGSQVVSYVYDSWGKLISTSGSLAETVGIQNPFRYREYYYDVETGFYYLQSRYYDPVTGRFINSDSLIGSTGELNSHNMFAYCGNEPINRVDPAGFVWYYPFNQYSDTGLEKKSYPFTSVSDIPIVKNVVTNTATGIVYGAIGYGVNKLKTNRTKWVRTPGTAPLYEDTWTRYSIPKSSAPAIRTVKAVSDIGVLSTASLAFDVYQNTQTYDNTSSIVAATGVDIAGFLVTLAAASCIPATAPVVVAVGISIGVVIAVSWCVDTIKKNFIE